MGLNVPGVMMLAKSKLVMIYFQVIIRDVFLKCLLALLMEVENARLCLLVG